MCTIVQGCGSWSVQAVFGMFTHTGQRMAVVWFWVKEWLSRDFLSFSSMNVAPFSVPLHQADLSQAILSQDQGSMFAALRWRLQDVLILFWSPVSRSPAYNRMPSLTDIKMSYQAASLARRYSPKWETTRWCHRFWGRRHHLFFRLSERQRWKTYVNNCNYVLFININV